MQFLSVSQLYLFHTLVLLNAGDAYDADDDEDAAAGVQVRMGGKCRSGGRQPTS